MSRKIARENAFQLIFEYNFTHNNTTDSLDNFLSNDELSDDDREFIKKIYFGVISKYDELIDTIKHYSHNYDLNRIFKVDVAILLLAIYELKYVDEVPPKVAINEAVSIVKKFSTDKSHQFVNGILAGIMKDMENNGNN